jgi:O-antigen/teichoic acid export membrane protein
MLASAVFRSFLLSVRGGLLGLEAFGVDTALVVGDRVVLTIACTTALVAGVGVLGLAVVFLVTRATTVAVAFVVARPHLGTPAWRFDPRAWAALQQRALPLGLFMMALTAYNYVDTVMLKGLTTGDETGLYNAAYRIYEGVTYAAAALSAVLTPRLASLWATSRQGHARLARLGLATTIAMALPLGAMLWWWAPFWMVLLPGPAYVSGAGVLRILAAGLPFVFIIWVLHAMATAAVRDRLLIRSTVVGLVANVGLNLWLIPTSGRDGAALATILGEMVTMAMLLTGLWATLTERADPAAREAGPTGPSE